MKTVRYVCTHCGRHFEAEEKDILECPGCFWSTSVKREEDLSQQKASSEIPKSKKFSLSVPSIPWKGVGFALGGLLFVFLFFRFLVPALGKIKWTFAEKKPAASQMTASPSPASPAQVAGLLPEEQNILNRRVQISADRTPSADEAKILSERAVFKTGFSEKLPSQAWTMDNFKEMIAQQEKFYQVPLPRSYKNKLYDLFKAQYEAGSEAFKNGDLLQARNLWVGALAFPLYSTDLQKHRAVALTMLRPFITDTLSKIGAINGSLVERNTREKEEQVAQHYAKLVQLIDQKKWQEALKSIADLENLLNDFSNPQSLAASPPPYPGDFGKVDRDIQGTLSELLNVPPPALSDVEPMQADIRRKKRVVESFIPENLSQKQVLYDEALDKIHQSKWSEAENILRQIDSPIEMMKDASEKNQVLRKLQKRSQEQASAKESVSS